MIAGMGTASRSSTGFSLYKLRIPGDGGVFFQGHPITSLSREKLFKEKSIDRTPAFFE
jgi:ABC-type oligopeptide transport system ATPase subunit